MLNEFIEKDERIQSLYYRIENHPEHKRKLKVEEIKPGSKGKISYGRSEVIVELDINLGEESILVLAHEFMHYLLVLEGALLPIEKESESEISSEAESLKYMLVKSITHHFLLKQELDSAGFEELQSKFALSDIIQEMPSCYFFEEETWSLELFDRSTFAINYPFSVLRERFESKKLTSVYELLENSPKETVEDINEISRALIREFNCEPYLV